MRPLLLLAIGLQLLELAPVAAEDLEIQRPFVTLPFSARLDQEVENAFESAAKQYGSSLCGITFPQNLKRCELANLRESDVADITSLRSGGSGTLLSATIDIARWARRLSIPALPDVNPMIASAGAPPRFAAPIEDISISAAPGSFRLGETVGGQRITHLQEVGADQNPAGAKISAIQAWREAHPREPEPARGLFGNEASAPRPHGDKTSATSLQISDERMSGMRW